MTSACEHADIVYPTEEGHIYCNDCGATISPANSAIIHDPAWDAADHYCPCLHDFKDHNLNGYPMTGDYCERCKRYCEWIQWTRGSATSEVAP